MEIQLVNNVARIKNKPNLNQAIADTGTTGHFILPGAPMDDVQLLTEPIEIEMPNGTTERSTHTCLLRIPTVPREVREAHVVPGLSHSSLVSIKKLCKGGCGVKFKEKTCEVYYRGKLVLTGKDVGPGGLWILPIDGRENLDEKPVTKQNPPNIAAATLYTLPYKQQKIKYMHQTFFVMPAATLEKAINNKQLKGIPMMNVKDIRRHLPPSPATPGGRMKKPSGGIRSTRRQNKDEFEKELENN